MSTGTEDDVSVSEITPEVSLSSGDPPSVGTLLYCGLCLALGGALALTLLVAAYFVFCGVNFAMIAALFWMGEP
jgi:hypothetical protein